MDILQNFTLTDKRAGFLLKVLKNAEDTSQL